MNKKLLALFFGAMLLTGCMADKSSMPSEEAVEGTSEVTTDQITTADEVADTEKMEEEGAKLNERVMEGAEVTEPSDAEEVLGAEGGAAGTMPEGTEAPGTDEEKAAQ